LNQAFTEYFQKIKQEWQVEIAKQLHEVVLENVPEVEERIQIN
jgi:hypothetical protein